MQSGRNPTTKTPIKQTPLTTLDANNPPVLANPASPSGKNKIKHNQKAFAFFQKTDAIFKDQTSRPGRPSLAQRRTERHAPHSCETKLLPEGKKIKIQ
jgi:hypothetical protein